jgi:hypothetical protein
MQRGVDWGNDWLSHINDLHDGEAKARDDTRLLDVLLLGPDDNAQHGWHNQACPHRWSAKSLNGVDQ